MDIVFNDNTKLIEKGISKKDCIEAMQTYAQQFKPEWTAVEDGLPEESGWYMTAYGKTVKSSYYCNRNKKFYSVYTPTDGYWRKSVTHWQPLHSLPNQNQQPNE